MTCHASNRWTDFPVTLLPTSAPCPCVKSSEPASRRREVPGLHAGAGVPAGKRRLGASTNPPSEDT